MRTLIILVFFLSSCTPSFYYVTTETTFEQIESQPIKKKLVYLNQDMGNVSMLDSIATEMNKKKWKNFDERIKALAKEDQQFLRSIKYMIKDEFLVSYHILDSLHSEAYNCQVQVLRTDCLYELNVDSVNFKAEYQDAMDCTQKENIKSIINTRYRFLRYDQ